jgi:hypothetical protein
VVEHYGVSVVQSVGSTKGEVYPRLSICVILKMGYQGCGNPISSIWQCQCANVCWEISHTPKKKHVLGLDVNKMGCIAAGNFVFFFSRRGMPISMDTPENQLQV